MTNNEPADVQKVRALYGDVAPDVNGEYVIPEEQITMFLEIAGGDALLAASFACGAIAGSELYLQRVLRTEDLQIDGAKAASEWRLRAKDLAEQSKQVDRGDLTVDFVYFPDVSPFSPAVNHAEGTAYPCL